MLWIALLFTALLALVRAFVGERDQGTLDGLILAPCDRSAIWLGKTLSVLAFLLFAEAVALPAFALFYESVTWELVAGVALANVGIAAVGTLLGAMAPPPVRASSSCRCSSCPWRSRSSSAESARLSPTTRAGTWPSLLSTT